MFGVLYHWLFGNSAGAEDVRQAIDELRESYESDTVTLGEPFIADESELEYSDRAKVVVPLRDAPYGADQRLLFDVPADRYDSTYEFIELLSLLGVEFETMEDIDGMEVPITFVGGSLCVMWSELSDDEDTEKGEEEDNAETDESDEDESSAVIEVTDETISTDEETPR